MLWTDLLLLSSDPLLKIRLLRTKQSIIACYKVGAGPAGCEKHSIAASSAASAFGHNDGVVDHAAHAISTSLLNATVAHTRWLPPGLGRRPRTRRPNLTNSILLQASMTVLYHTVHNEGVQQVSPLFEIGRADSKKPRPSRRAITSRESYQLLCPSNSGWLAPYTGKIRILGVVECARSSGR